MDRVYMEILKQGLLPSTGRIADLGCGQGLTLAAILSAQKQYERNTFPRGWPPPPSDIELNGFDIREREVGIARQALSTEANIEVVDLRRFDIPRCQAVIILDVLHYLAPEDQETLIERIGLAVENGGTIVLREADESEVAGFYAVRYSEVVRARLRGQWRQRFHYRSGDDWAQQLERLGFETRVQEMRGRAPFRNVLVHGLRRS